jgi:hypothetical protein
MNVLVWYIDPNEVENKNILKCPYHTDMKNMKSSF